MATAKNILLQNIYLVHNNQTQTVTCEQAGHPQDLALSQKVCKFQNLDLTPL